MAGMKRLVELGGTVGLAAFLAGCGMTSSSASEESGSTTVPVETASIDFDTRVGGEPPAILLLAEPAQSGFHLVRAGEVPSSDTVVEFPGGFHPAEPANEKSPFRGDYLQIRNVGQRGFTEDGRFLVGVGRDGDMYELVVIEVSTGNRRTALEGSDELAAYLVGNRVVVLAEKGESDDYLLLDPSLAGNPIVLGSADDVHFSLDGRFIALTENGDVTVLEIPGGRKVLTVEARRLQFAPDGEHVAVANDSGVSIFELPSGELTATESGFEASHTRLGWNSGDALVAFDYLRDPVLITMDKKRTALPPGFDSASFISPSSRDLFLLDEGRDSIPSYFVAESEEVIPLNNLRPFDTNGMFGFVPILDPSVETYSELLYIGRAGNQINRLTPQGLEEVLVASPGLVPYQAVRAGDTNYFLFFSEDDKGERTELYSQRGDTIRLIYKGAGSGSYFVWETGDVFLRGDLEGESEHDDRVILALSHSDAREVSRAVFDYAVIASDLSEAIVETYSADYYLVAAHAGSG